MSSQSKDRNEFRRNSSFVKPYLPIQESTMPEQETTMPDATSDPPASPPRVAAPTPPTPRPSRPSRSVKPSARFADFVFK